jgi:hypothetical protein
MVFIYMTKPKYSFLYYLLLFIVFYFLVAPVIIYEFNRQNGIEGFSGLSFTGSFFIIFAIVAVICFLAFFLFKSLFKD